MTDYTLDFSAEARNDLRAIGDRIAVDAGLAVARRYIERLETYCVGFRRFPHRGRQLPNVGANVRMVGFERRVTIVFAVTNSRIEILRVFGPGRDWERELAGAAPET